MSPFEYLTGRYFADTLISIKKGNLLKLMWVETLKGSELVVAIANHQLVFKWRICLFELGIGFLASDAGLEFVYIFQINLLRQWGFREGSGALDHIVLSWKKLILQARYPILSMLGS